MDKQQQLYRLTSQSNDGVFDTLFDQDIEIAAGAEIALQSASFDRQSDQITIDSSNESIAFGLEIENWEANMDNGTFSELVDGKAMLTSTAANMNQVIDMNDPDHQETYNGHVYSIDKGSQWQLQLDADGKTEIAAKTYPASPISNALYGATTAFSTTNVLAGATPPAVTPGGVIGTLDSMGRATGTSAQNEYNDSYVYGKVRMTKGTGCIRVRLAGIVGNGAAPRATIGLVEGTAGLAKLQSATITTGDIKWGMQVNGNNHQYLFTEGSGAWQNAPGNLQPLNYSPPTGAVNNNDVLDITIGGTGFDTQQAIEMAVHQVGGSTKLSSAAPVYPDKSVDWYYFVSFHQAIDDFSLDMMEVDFDPYTFKQDTYANPPAPIQESTLGTVIRSGWSYPLGFPLADRRGIFDWGSAEVGAFFGFGINKPDDIIGNSLAKSELYTFTSGLRAEFSVTAKNYLVMFDTTPLNSFDSYAEFDAVARAANAGGSRRNLLATVPVKEDQVGSTSVSQVAFEPNTLNYISLRNRSPVLTRQLKCRVLTSTYQPVIIDGMASLTVLIRS